MNRFAKYIFIILDDTARVYYICKHIPEYPTPKSIPKLINV